MNNSPKDYLTDRLKEFDKKFHDNEVDGFVDNTKEEIKAFLTETITQSMEVGREKEYTRGYKCASTKLIKELQKFLSDYSVGCAVESYFDSCGESHRSGLFEAIRDFEKKLKSLSPKL